MRKPGCMLLLAAILSAPPALAQGGRAARDLILRGPGATITCGAWLELREASEGLFAVQKREQYRSVVGWALGYLSGAARYGDNLDPLRRADEEATIAWLAAFCRGNQGTEVRRALDAFIEAHPAR